MYTTTVPVIAENDFNKEELLKELRRCNADRIAFALYRDPEHTFTSPETLKKTGELIDYFREKGFSTVIWIGETLGHDQVTKHPDGCETPYRRMKLPNKGTVDSFCPTDERFVRDLAKWMKKAAELHPDLIMIDDDFRMNGGCCCDAHVAWMNREAGENLTADEWFCKAFTGGKNKYRDIWMKVQGESLYTVARALRKAVDSVDPAIRLGVCASYYLWDGDGASAETIVRILAGNTKPFLRTFGAPYHSYDHPSKLLGCSLELERCEFDWCKDWEIEFISEGDTYPRPRFYCPAAYLECFDQILRADGNAGGILKYTMDYTSDAYYERGYTDAWERNLPLYQEIGALFSGKTATGVHPYLAQHLLQDADLGKNAPGKDFKILSESAGDYNPSAELAVMNNLPTAYGGGGVKILFGENARSIPEEELKTGCILDLTASEILQQRGIDTGVSTSGKSGEFPVSYLGGASQYFVKENCRVRISGAVLPCSVRLKEGAEILTEFVSGNHSVPGWVRYENPQGMRFLVFPFRAKDVSGKQASRAGYLNGYALRRMLTEQIAWLGKPLDAYVDGNHPYLYTLVKKSGTAMSVGVWNLFSDKIPDLSFRINGNYPNVRFVNGKGIREGDRVRLTSVLYPYEFVGIELQN